MIFKNIVESFAVNYAHNSIQKSLYNEFNIDILNTTYTKTPKKDKKYMLYAHVPFCHTFCPYCSFHKYHYEQELAKIYFENKGYTVVYTDAKNSNNLNKVIDKAKEELAEKIARQVAKGIKPRAIRSMVIGVPNVGKSTFINKLIKKNVANTANKPGVTKKQQWLKLNKDIELLDTPGILMPKFDNQEIGKKLSLIGSIKDDITPLDDVSLYLIELLKENYLENLNNLYKINVNSDDENVFIMEKVAEKRFKKIGGDYDYDSTIKLLIQDFRTQKFGLITLDNYNDLLENEEQNEN